MAKQWPIFTREQTKEIMEAIKGDSLTKFLKLVETKEWYNFSYMLRGGVDPDLGTSCLNTFSFCYLKGYGNILKFIMSCAEDVGFDVFDTETKNDCSNGDTALMIYMLDDLWRYGVSDVIHNNNHRTESDKLRDIDVLRCFIDTFRDKAINGIYDEMNKSFFYNMTPRRKKSMFVAMLNGMTKSQLQSYGQLLMNLLGYKYGYDMKNEINQILKKNGLPALKYEGGEDRDIDH